MKWSPQQDAALRAVSDWLKKPEPPVFRLFGYAGTGKTTMARHLAEGVKGKVLFAAFSGKAANVMLAQGCEGARTLHSLVYYPPPARGRLRWEVNRESDLAGAGLLVVDEVSMVSGPMAKDILSFGVPVLALGDPAQLPPVDGEGFFTDAEPDIMLTEIHRQARDNPIIDMAARVREGETLPYGQYGDCAVVERSEPEDALAADQLLVGLNRTRQGSNSRIRKLKGHTEKFPRKGERLICLRNDRIQGLLNGTIFLVNRDAAAAGDFVFLDLAPEGGGERALLMAHPHPFLGQDIPRAAKLRAQEFCYGYAITVHKAQGSQWDKVLVIDEWGGDDHERWLYTAITRARKSITIIRRPQ